MPQSSMSFTHLLFLAISALPAACEQVPLKAAQSSEVPPHPNAMSKNIAIVGSGAAGAATAYFLKQLSSDDLTYNVTIFEKGDLPGGRAMSTHLRDYDVPPLEWGAASFSEFDSLLSEIIKDVGLDTEVHSADSSDETAIWDGKDLKFRHPSLLTSLTDWGRMIRLFGLGFLRSYRLGKGVLSILRRLTDAIPIHNTFRSSEQLGAEHSLWWPPLAYLESKSISGPFVDQYVPAIIRGHFGLEMGDTNAYHLALALGHITEKPFRLSQGFMRLIESMISKSGAVAHYDRAVNEMRTDRTGSVQLRSESTSNHGLDKHESTFDSVVIAAPFASTNILTPGLVISPPSVEYTAVYVTNFLSCLELRADMFNLEPGEKVPEDIITLSSEASKGHSDTDLLDFYRLTTVSRRSESPSECDPRQPNVYRLLTAEAPTEDQLEALLKEPENETIEPIEWQYTHHWPFAWPKADYEQSPYNTRITDTVFATANMELLGSSLENAVTAGKNAAEMVHEQMKRQSAVRACQTDEYDLDE